MFLHDIFYVVDNGSLFNYADDNTVSWRDVNLQNLVAALVNDTQLLITWFANNGMSANPDKLQALLLSPHQGEVLRNPLCVDGNAINPGTHVKLLGVTIDEHLTFERHIDEIWKKAAKQVNALCRLIKCLPLELKLKIYQSFIFSNFRYCCLVWHFCAKSGNRKLEKIQERALRFVDNDFVSTYDELLMKSTSSSVLGMCLKAMAIEIYKSLHDLNPRYIQNLLSVKETTHSLRNNQILERKPFRTITHGFRSFIYQSAVIWDSISNETKNAENVQIFKRSLNSWPGPKCTCKACTL